MPELIVAPSPSPSVNAAANNASNHVDPAAAKPATTNAAPADGSNDQAATPFAAILKHQMEQPPADGKTTKTVAALLAAAGLPDNSAAAKLFEDPAAAATPADTAAAAAPTDALTFLAPMLPGLAPTTTESGKKAAAKDADKGDSGTVVIAAAVPIAVVAQGALSAPTPTTSESIASAMDTSARSSAILAAQTAAVTETAGTPGKSGSSAQDGFESLLSAARDASLAAANNSVATHTNTHATAIQPSTAATPIATPVGAQGWDSEVGQKIVWMANRQESHAEFVLNPPHLGRIEVSLSMNGDQASATFVSANPAVREALENAVPRLREIMQDAGISLGQTQVGAESFQQSAGSNENSDNRTRGGGDTRNADVAAPVGFVGSGNASTQWVRYSNGLVDTFA